MTAETSSHVEYPWIMDFRAFLHFNSFKTAVTSSCEGPEIAILVVKINGSRDWCLRRQNLLSRKPQSNVGDLWIIMKKLLYAAFALRSIVSCAAGSEVPRSLICYRKRLADVQSQISEVARIFSLFL